MSYAQRRILYIDDDYTDQKIVEIMLRDRNVTVDECLDPTSAGPKIEKNGYDAILVDYRLPLLNGVELIKRLKNKVHCPIYIVSAHEEAYVKAELSKHDVQVEGFIWKNGLKQNLAHLMEILYGKKK